jgi:uncharacterized repeat protein (TIGR03803 family)
MLPSASSLPGRFCITAVLAFWLFFAIAPTTSAQTFTVLYSFTGGPDGGDPFAGLVLDSADNLYGITTNGGTGTCVQDFLSGCGTVFRVTKQGAETVLHSFQGGSDGEFPNGGLALDDRGYLFGTTVNGGATANGGLGFGILFSLDKSGTEHILHRFTGGTDGAYPSATLTLDQGHLYGTSDSGGDLSCGFQDKGCGTLFGLDASRGSVVHRFAGAPSDGRSPGYGALLIDSAGNFYGTTGEGGSADAGTVYKVDRNGQSTVLYSFSGKSDGCEPLGSLAADEHGTLYGAASECGDFNKGTLFKIDSTGSFTVLYAFSGGADDGNAPFGGVTLDRSGNLYGTTLFGGNCGLELGGCGTVFKLNPNGHMTILHTFEGETDGSSPWCNVILDAAGNLYGTTSMGGLGGNGAGTVWKLAP